MKYVRTRVRAVAVGTALYLLPVIAQAAQCEGTSGFAIANPLKYCSIMAFVEAALRLFVMLALPVLAFFIVLAGFSFILARGNSTKLQAAKWNFLYVIVGTCLVLGAWLLASLIGATITQITG